MPIARSFTQKLAKLGRTTSFRKSPSDTPNDSPITPTDGNCSDYFYSINFEDTKKQPQPSLGDRFTFNPENNTPTITTLNRASSLLSRRSSRSRRRVASDASTASSSSVSTPLTTLPPMSFSPSPSLSSFPATPGSLHSSSTSTDCESVVYTDCAPPLTPSRGFFNRHRNNLSNGSSCYSAQHSLNSCPELSKPCNIVSEEEEADMVAMMILEKVSAKDYTDELDTCFT